LTLVLEDLFPFFFNISFFSIRPFQFFFFPFDMWTFHFSPNAPLPQPDPSVTSLHPPPPPFLNYFFFPLAGGGGWVWGVWWFLCGVWGRWGVWEQTNKKTGIVLVLLVFFFVCIQILLEVHHFTPIFSKSGPPPAFLALTLHPCYPNGTVDELRGDLGWGVACLIFFGPPKPKKKPKPLS